MKTSAVKVIFAVLLFIGGLHNASAQATAFTYQGQLNDGATAAGGTYQMQFALYDAATNGNQIGTTITNTNVTVTNGVFTVQLDFAATPFGAGVARFLQIAVRKPAETNYTTLAPRQQITSAPYSIRTLSAAAADSLSTACVACVTDAQIAAVDGTKVTGGSIANLNASNLTSGTVPLARLGTNAPTATTFLRGDNTWATVSGGGSGASLQLVATHTGGSTLPVNGNPALNISFSNVITAPTAGTFDGTTFTATTGGIYLVIGQLGVNNNSSSSQATQISPFSQIAVNGVLTALGTSIGTISSVPVSETPGRGVVTAVLVLNANDSVVVQAKSGNSASTSTLVTNGLTRLTIVKLN